MRIAILGTGTVAQTLATALSADHEVVLGSRTAGKDRSTFADAAAWGEVAILAVTGTAATEVARRVSGGPLAGKILIDVTNPLDFSNGFPPALSTGPDESLAEQIQATLPETMVVKALNTVTAALMVDPRSLADGDHTLFVAGDDPAACDQVATWLGEWFGWDDVLILGDLSNARGTESLLLLWTRVMGKLGTPRFQFRVVRPSAEAPEGDQES